MFFEHVLQQAKVMGNKSFIKSIIKKWLVEWWV